MGGGFFDDGYKSVLPEKLRWRNWAIDDKSGSALTGDELLKFVNDELFSTLKNLPVTFETPKKKSVVREVFAGVNHYMKNGVLLRQVINVINEVKLDTAKEKNFFGDIYETILKSLQSAGNGGEFYTPRSTRRGERKRCGLETFKAKSFTGDEIIGRGYDLDLCDYPSSEEEILSPIETIRDFQERCAALNSKIDSRLEKLSLLLQN